ncbi:MAG: Patatin [Cyanobacteria bacterium RYN_339]|nr:Patatin [Cyanobacteria bacterium RYN_339]
MGKIGLVLSGGVAKGAYEVGVIQAMAERGIEPAAIVGISAGALNGALMASLIVSENFTPAAVIKKLRETWVERVSLSHFYHCFDGDEAHQDLDRKSLNNLFLRFGIDPFNKVYLPTRFDPKALATLENILRGNFVSMFSHAYFRRLAHDFEFPHDVKKAVKFSAVICNLMGQTTLSEDESIETAWAHFEDFGWYPNMPRTENFIQYSRLLDTIFASSSFPLAFSPMRLTMPGASKPGLFVDGGFADNAPIGKVIHMDSEIDTVIVVMATTMVPPPEQEPDNILLVFSRMAEMLAGKFLINNYHRVQKVNRQLAALGEVLEKEPGGEYKGSAFNEKLCIAAGFEGLADFRRRRIVRIVPIIPSTPLKGTLFAGFQDPKLLEQYIDLGLANAREVLDKRLVAGAGG